MLRKMLLILSYFNTLSNKVQIRFNCRFAELIVLTGEV